MLQANVASFDFSAIKDERNQPVVKGSKESWEMSLFMKTYMLLIGVQQ